MPNPIFIVGTGRSGTSVLLQAIGKHPQVLGMPGEAPLLTTFGAIGHLFEENALAEYYNASLRMPRKRLYEKLRTLCFESAGGDHYGLKLIIDSFRRGEGVAWKKRYWCCKTFPPLIVANGLKRLFPTAKFIYIIRNGLDVVQSMIKFPGFQDREFAKQCSTWSEEVEKYRYLLTYEAAIQLRHEDLVLDPGSVLMRVFQFLGLQYDERPSQFLATTLVHPLDRPDVTVESTQEVLLKRGPAHEKWSAQQKELFRSVCGAAMREAGYEVPF